MRNSGEKIFWLVAGAGIGAGATYLFGTREGRRYRRQVARMVEDGCEQLEVVRQDVLESGKEVFERGKEIVEETGAKVSRKLHLAHN